MRRTHLLIIAILALSAAVTFAADRVTKDDKGRIVAVPLKTEARFLNTDWTAEAEDRFRDRADAMIRRFAGKGYGGTYGESEKRSYPNAMMDLLAGNTEKAVKFLESRDAENGRDSNTPGIDFYWCFTLKGQCRKYFYFGDYLSDDYRARMKDAARQWTDTDPRRRANPQRGQSQNKSWGAAKTGVCVDTRGTDNLHAMRIAAVYLFAEETGNKEVAAIYKRKIATAVKKMFRTGMGEWDSENYHGHTMTGYIQLYDFAKDPEVKLMGKAAMDYLLTTGAFKYWRGAFGGPTKRDYNHPYVHGGSAADHIGLYIGDYGKHYQDNLNNKDVDFHWASDNVHFITSAYRPPMAVYELGRKNFTRPVEVFVAHPPYGALRSDAIEQPRYLETQFFADTYQFGTLSRGTHDQDVNGFKALIHSEARGADYFIANATGDPFKIGSAKYGGGVERNNVAQYRNLAIWLAGPGDSPFTFLAHQTTGVEQVRGVTFLRYERTWLAIHPINLKIDGVNEALTQRVRGTEKKPKWPDVKIISAKGNGGNQPSGFAVEFADAATHKSYDAFKEAALKRAKLDTSQLANGVVSYTAADGASVKMQYVEGNRPRVWRNGKAHDWSEHRGIYQPADGGNTPIRMDWADGKLHVEAGGHTFDAEVDDQGRYTFKAS